MGLSTVMDDVSKGYNGWVANVKIGYEWDAGRALAVDGFLGWSVWTWQNGVGDNVASFGSFRVSSFAIGVSLIFHPVLHLHTQQSQ